MEYNDYNAEGKTENLTQDSPYKVPYQGTYYAPPQNAAVDNNKGKILGILSIIFSFVCIPITGTILGIIGLIRAKDNVNNKTPKVLNIIGICTSIFVMILGVVLFIFVFSKSMKSDSSFFYGNTSGEAVIERYWKAVKHKDRADAEKCFPEELNVKLTGGVWDEGNQDTAAIESTYEWDLDCLEYEDDKRELTEEEISDMESQYKISISSGFMQTVSCDYIYIDDSGTSQRDRASVLFTVCKIKGRYYLVKAEDTDYPFGNEPDDADVEETGYFPLGNGDIGKININSATTDINGSTFTEDEEYTNTLKGLYTDAEAYIQLNEDESGNRSAVYLIKYDRPDKTLELVAKEMGSMFAGSDELSYGKDLMGFEEAYYCCGTKETDTGFYINTDVYTVEGNDNIYRCLVLVYPVYDEVTAGLWQYYEADCGFKKISMEDYYIDTEEPIETDTEATTELSTEAATEAEGSSNKIGDSSVGYLTVNTAMDESTIFTDMAGGSPFDSYTGAYDCKEYAAADHQLVILMYKFPNENAKDAFEGTKQGLELYGDTITYTGATVTVGDGITAYKLQIEASQHQAYYYFDLDGELYHIEIMYSDVYAGDIDSIIASFEK